MPGTTNIAITDRGNAFYDRLIGARPADFVNTFGTDLEVHEMMAEIIGSMPKDYATLGDFLNNVCIDGKKLSHICADRNKSAFENAGDAGKNFFMAAEFYRCSVNRDCVMQITSDNPDDPARSDVSLIRPDVKSRNFIARIANAVRELFGLSGSNKAYDKLTRDYGEPLGEIAKANADLEKAAKAKQPERDEIQRAMIEVELAHEKGKDADDKAFFAEENFPKVEDEGLAALFKEAPYESNLAARLTDASKDLELETIGTRVITRVNFAMMYMLYKGHSIETIMSQEPEVMELKKQIGKEVVGILFSDDHKKSKEIITDVSANMVKWLADEKNYPKFDITDDKSIVEAMQKPEYRFATTVSKDLEQIVFYEKSGGQYSPYLAAVKEKVGEDVYAKYVSFSESFGKTAHFTVNMRQDFILSGVYSQQYTSMSPEKQSVIKQDPNAIAKGYGALELAHSLHEKYGNNLTEMPGFYVGWVGSAYNTGKLSFNYPKFGAADKFKITNQTLLGVKPFVSDYMKDEKEEVISDYEKECRVIKEKEQQMAGKKDVSVDFTASKQPSQAPGKAPDEPKPKPAVKESVK